MTRAPCRAAIRAAASTVARGISSCTSTVSPTLRMPASGSTSCGRSPRLAPAATAMLFSPPSSTKIRATPEGVSGTRRMRSTSMPSATKLWNARSPKSSAPSAVTNTTAAPARTAAIAWFAPLPPAVIWKPSPRTVSPGAGILRHLDRHIGIRAADDNDFAHSAPWSRRLRPKDSRFRSTLGRDERPCHVHRCLGSLLVRGCALGRTTGRSRPAVESGGCRHRRPGARAPRSIRD